MPRRTNQIEIPVALDDTGCWDLNILALNPDGDVIAGLAIWESMRAIHFVRPGGGELVFEVKLAQSSRSRRPRRPRPLSGPNGLHDD